MKRIILGISLITLPLLLIGISDAAIDPETCVGAWLFDEGAGELAEEFTGSGFDGELKNGPEWVDGMFGSALEFDGSTALVDCGNNPSTFITEDPLTLTAWIKPTGSGRRAIIDRGDKYIFEVGPRDEDILALYYLSNWLFSGHVIINEIWVHVAAAFDGKDTIFYVDGENVSTVPTAGAVAGPRCNFVIGSQCACNYFNGVIDEVAVFNVALGEDDIGAIMNHGLMKALTGAAVSPPGKLATAWGEVKVSE